MDEIAGLHIKELEASGRYHIFLKTTPKLFNLWWIGRLDLPALPTGSSFRSAYIVLETTKVGKNILEDIFAGRGPKGIAEKRKRIFRCRSIKLETFLPKIVWNINS